MGLFGSIKKAADDTCKGYDKVKTNKKMTYEELYEVIKDGNFAVGKPALVGKGIMHCIVSAQFLTVSVFDVIGS